MVSNSSDARRRVGASALAAGICLALGAGGAAAQPDAPGGPGGQSQLSEEQVEVTDHGELAVEADLNISDTGTLPDGTNAHYVVGSGNPANFHVVNADTGAVISTHSIEPRSMGGAVEVADDGSAYFQLRDGAGASLYHWDSETHDVELLAENPVGQRFVQSLHLDEGMLYGSTYPSAKVFSYDLETEEFHDYGSVASDDVYAATMTVIDGTAYVGTGMEVGRAVAVDLDTGEMTELEIPADYDERLTRFYASQQVGDLVAMAFSTGPDHEGTNTLFFDTATEEWVCDSAIPEMVSLNSPYTGQTQDGRIFYLSEGEIWQFDSSDCSVETTGWIDTNLAETGNHRTLNVLATGGEDAEEFTLIGMNRDGSYWTFDPETGRQEIFDGQIQPSPLTAHSVHVGLDDRVYMGTYNGPGTLGRFDPDTAELEPIAGPSQADSFLNFGDQMLVGSYANAVVHSGDLTQEWDWGTNPEQQFRLIDDYQQDRIVGMDTDGQRAALATVSDYGIQGGALTLLQLDGERETHRDLIQAQSTASVAFGADGLVYAGTSIRGGISSPNSTEDAHLVVFDPEAGEVLDAIVPVPDNDVVAGLVAVDEEIWGVTNSAHVFVLDTQSQEITHTEALGTDRSASNWGLASTIQTHPDGMLYGISSGDIFTIDPQTRESQILLDGAYKRMDIADDGTIYAIDATSLFALHLDEGQSPLAQLGELQAVTTGYREDGDIAAPLAGRLDNALAQAQRHLTEERPLPAARVLGDFQRHLDPDLDSEVITEAALLDLTDRANVLLDLLG